MVDLDLTIMPVRRERRKSFTIVDSRLGNRKLPVFQRSIKSCQCTVEHRTYKKPIASKYYEHEMRNLYAVVCKFDYCHHHVYVCMHIRGYRTPPTDTIYKYVHHPSITAHNHPE